MDITPVVGAEFQLISGYGDCGFTISGIRYEGSVLVLPRRTISVSIADMHDLSETLFEPLIAESTRPGILIIGCGKGMKPVPPALRVALRTHGIIVEPMDTGAACRTYNVLLTEGRDVAALLIAV